MRKGVSSVVACALAAVLAVGPALPFAGAEAFAADAEGGLAAGSSIAVGQQAAAEGAAADAVGDSSVASSIEVAKPSVKRGKKTVENGVYLLSPNAKATQVVAIAGNSKKSGANARIAGFAASEKQTYRVEYDKKGFYTITNVNSGKQLATAALKKREVPATVKTAADASDASANAGTASGETAAAGGAAASGETSSNADPAASDAVNASPDAGAATDTGADVRAATGAGADAAATDPAASDAATDPVVEPEPKPKFTTVKKVNVGQYALGKKSDRAKWRIDKSKDGYRLVNKATGFALEMADSKHANGSNVRAAVTTAKPVKAKAAQRFSLVSPGDIGPSASQVKGTFYIEMEIAATSVVGIRDDSRMEGATAAIRAKRNTNLERFTIGKAKNGCYYLQNVATSRVISLPGPTMSRTDVVMRDKKGASYQMWKVVYNDDFSYAFENVYSGKHLNVAGGAVAANTGISAETEDSASVAQRFKLKATTPRTDEKVEINVPCYIQNPELPTGCESVACANAIRYWGYGLSKTEIANRWMPYGGDGVYNFIGNPRDSSGWIICAPGIANTANAYLRSKGSSVHATVVKGSSLSSLRKYLDRGFPVVVWTTIGMGYPGGVSAWNRGYPLRSNNHAVVLSGYDPVTGNYRVSDSLAGVVWRDGGRFTWLYNEMGRQAVVLQR